MRTSFAGFGNVHLTWLAPVLVNFKVPSVHTSSESSIGEWVDATRNLTAFDGTSDHRTGGVETVNNSAA